MLNESERLSLIGNIERLPDELEAAVRGLTGGQLDLPYRDGGWTIRQVVHHLADSHANAIIRMKLAMTEDYPTLKTYDQDRWVELGDAAMPIEPSVLILRGLHQRWGALLRTLPAEAWGRQVLHPENGAMSIDDLLHYYGGHGANHVAQITGLRESQGW